jgi:hypothetical protein
MRIPFGKFREKKKEERRKKAELFTLRFVFALFSFSIFFFVFWLTVKPNLCRQQPS